MKNLKVLNRKIFNMLILITIVLGGISSFTKDIDAKDCNGTIIYYQNGPDSNTASVDMYEITFDISNIVEEFDFIGFPDMAVNTINIVSLDTNQDGYSDRDFFTKSKNIITWKPTNEYRRIYQQGCYDRSFNTNCGYAMIAVKRKLDLESGSGTVLGQVRGKLSNGEDYILQKTFTVSFSNCVVSQSNISVTPQTNMRRLALVVGNADYPNNPLLNPLNDVKAIAIILKRLGFEVLKYENLSQSEMKQAIDEFGQKLKNYDTGLFYYSGHGVQVNGENYLIPIDANPKSENDAEYDCVNAGRVLGKMEDAGSTTNIMILDACRVNPFERSWTRSPTGKGLAVMMAPTGSLIAYATSSGKVAYDEPEKSNSPYTAALLQYLETPNLSILEMFQKVRSKVIQETNKKQTPWESTSLTGNFYFRQK